jgi:hypothetical protein
MEFGLIKSKAEKKLNDSYLDGTFKEEILNFKKLILNNESLSKAFHIYNELNENKGFSERFAEDYLEECIDLFDRLEVDEKSYFLLENWVRDVKCENNYKMIDNVLNKTSVLIEERINSKSKILENLQKQKNKKEIINIPIEKMVSLANENIKKFLSQLNESDLNEVKKYNSLSKNDLKIRYNFLSEMVMEKLNNISQSSDKETKERINETIKKIETQEINSLNLFRLKNLNDTI